MVNIWLIFISIIYTDARMRSFTPAMPSLDVESGLGPVHGVFFRSLATQGHISGILYMIYYIII